MRICFLANLKSVHVHRWATYFAGKGHDVHLLFFPGDFGINEITDDIFPGYSEYNNLHFHRIKTLNFGKKNNRRIVRYMDKITNAHFQRLIREIPLKRTFKKINPDILHAHYLGYFGEWGNSLKFHPFVVSAWGSDVFSIKTKEGRMKINRVLDDADVITTTTEHMKEHIKETFETNTPIEWIPWGIDLSVFHKGYDEEVHEFKNKYGITGQTILFSRGITPNYNPVPFIESLPDVIQKHPNVMIVILKAYADTAQIEMLKNRAKTLGVHDNIIFISKLLNASEMAVLLNSSDIFMSIPDSDQFGSSVIEAMNCGLIPIVSDIKVYYQYLRHNENALMVNPKNPGDIAKNINHALENPELKNAAFEINKKIVEEKEDWNKQAGIMEKLYLKMIEDH